MIASTDTTENDKLPISWRIAERAYWVKRWIGNHARGVLYKLLPNWLVREVFMYAQRYIANNEVVPEVEFMTVFQRIVEKKVMSGTRVTK